MTAKLSGVVTRKFAPSLRNLARLACVVSLPVGEVSKIECGSNAAGTQSNWACVNVANVSQNHRAKRGCKRANNWRGEAARTDRVTVFRGDSSPIRPLLEF